jgi:hypothetical protein
VAAKIRNTLPKIESALLVCHDQLGRWPNSCEYDRVRQKALPTFEDPRDFPSQPSILSAFGGWTYLLAYMQQLYPERVAGPTTPTYVERAMLYCHQILGRWPNSHEYIKLRKNRFGAECERNFPSASKASVLFGSWGGVIARMRELYPDLAHVEPEAMLVHRVETAMGICRDELGRWPREYAEYEVVRQRLMNTLENPRDFPPYLSIRKAFGGWRPLLVHMRDSNEPADID